ncbi:hypothetical protein RUM43_011338 [Polyplax serrata]|uniref:Uncharacterized protein n=1 Tax=Polyplax serrata TaxID=468196 RepID=A0AAN8NY54_POLSC
MEKIYKSKLPKWKFLKGPNTYGTSHGFPTSRRCLSLPLETKNRTRLTHRERLILESYAVVPRVKRVTERKEEQNEEVEVEGEDFDFEPNFPVAEGKVRMERR